MWGADDDDSGLSAVTLPRPCQWLAPRWLLPPALASLWMLESTSSYEGGMSGGAEGSSIAEDDDAGGCGGSTSFERRPVSSPPEDGPCLSMERIVLRGEEERSCSWGEEVYAE
ncbi:hypothetical protein GGI00_002616 [Coemansia sp. RSA 2681]|nr:hypothetical protein GGI00_002616 [Coemansia sp. RSA 2681]